MGCGSWFGLTREADKPIHSLKYHAEASSIQRQMKAAAASAKEHGFTTEWQLRSQNPYHPDAAKTPES